MFATINIHLIDTFSYTIIIWQDRMSNKNVSRWYYSAVKYEHFIFFVFYWSDRISRNHSPFFYNDFLHVCSRVPSKMVKHA